MSEQFTITIVGTGVIGTSLGLALKQQDEAIRLIAHDKELSIAKEAVKQGAFDKAAWNLVNACEQADLVILAIPLNGVRPTLEAIAPYLKREAVVSDTGRSKKPVMAWAKELLPETVHFVGGNPIVYPTGSGYEHARADLFQNRLYCLTPAPNANEEAVPLVVRIIDLLGAEPFFLDAAEHDGLTTAVELLPTVLSVALMNTLSGPSSWRESRKLAGRFFEQATAGAENEPDDLRESWLANRPNLLHWLDNFMAQLDQLRTRLAEDEEEAEELLLKALEKANTERARWLADHHQGSFIGPNLPTAQVEKRSFVKQLFGIGR